MSSNPQSSTQGRQSPSAEKQADPQIGQPSSAHGKGAQKNPEAPQKASDNQLEGLSSNPEEGPMDKEVREMRK
ncbi:hypothetical protein K440DRAFT_616597 [Wilcoxina mikolae CBS 423.85]|nr:hypothetical protein K440DRAFT_616597 [Wilcoxina mikolae CBS 423.85]